MGQASLLLAQRHLSLLASGDTVPECSLNSTATLTGASSGLHHDYHDNLYVLLEGRKTFRLWCPAHAQSMYTHGRLVKVHPNGRIVYQGQVSSNSKL